MNSKEQIEELLIANKLEEAIKALLEGFKEIGEDRLYNDVLLLSARFNSLENDQRKGLISNDDYNRGSNRLRHALNEYLEEYVPSEKKADSPVEKEKKEVAENAASGKDHLEELLAQDRLEEVISEMMKGLKAIGDRMYNDMIMLSGQLRSLEKKQNQGMMSVDNYNRERNRIRSSVYSYLEDYEPPV